MSAIAQRVRNMLGRGIVRLVNDAKKAQELQVELLADEAQDGVERFQNYGFTSVPLEGAEALVAFVGGLRSHGIALAVEDRRYRMQGLKSGEVAIYDDRGQMMILKRDGISIASPDKVTITAPSVIVDADSVALGGEGGAAVARVGDPVSGGIIQSGSEKVSAA